MKKIQHAYVVYGNDQGFAAELRASSLSVAGGGDGDVGLRFNGLPEAPSLYSFGSAGILARSADDINGDGLPDLILSDRDADVAGVEDSGQVYIIYGQGASDADDAHWKTNPYAVSIEQFEVTSDSVLELPLAAGGGAAVPLKALAASER